MPNFHPILVHFPIAVLALALLFDLIGHFTKNQSLERAGWWSQLAGTVALGAALLSGLLAEREVVIPALASSTLDTHEQIALIVSAASCALLLWRIAHRTHLPEKLRPLFLFLMTLTVLALWAGGYFGGELVYRYGVGVR